MADAELIELIRRYSLKGIDDWSNARPELKRRAATCLGVNSIAESQREVEQAINTWFRNHTANRLFYIPMPSHSTKIDQAFFLPIRESVEGTPRTSFDLFLLVTEDRTEGAIKDRCLAFRWEQPERPTNTHGYAHVQFCRITAKRSHPHVEIPSWLPDSYPAIPIGSSDPTQMFLLMATSIHGYPERMDDILPEIFKNRPLIARSYQQTLGNRLATS